MAITRFMGFLNRLRNRKVEKEKKHYRDLIISSHLTAISLTAALLNEREMPSDPSEKEKKPKRSEIRRVREDMAEHSQRWSMALRSPADYAEYVGWGHLFEEILPEEREKTPEEVEAEKEAAREARNKEIQEANEAAERVIMNLQATFGDEPVFEGYSPEPMVS